MTTISLGQMPKGYQANEPQSVYWTLSLYVDRDNLKDILGFHPQPEHYRAVQMASSDSLELRNAMEPLFNDIADREREGRVDDILLAASTPRQGETIAITAPGQIEWETEGSVFCASPPGLDTPRAVDFRRFWYSHLDGAVSYHLSFRIAYEHTPADFYFLSLLQKAAAPKEFSRNNAHSLEKGKARSRRPTDARLTGVQPLDEMLVSDTDVKDARFWHFVKRRFEADARALIPRLQRAGHGQSVEPDPAHAPPFWDKYLNPPLSLESIQFETLVVHSPFIEVPGLEMPLARFMFFFNDETLFERLMPPLSEGETARAPRSLMCQERCYVRYPAKIEELVEKGRHHNPPRVDMDRDYWDWLASDKYTDEEFNRLKTTRPAMQDKARTDCLHYLFMAGFCQNIIDFMNQDASEVQDSLDPVYPTNDRQDEESFFVRFANPRALVTFVKRSRSLDTGNDYIGTCPYAFLIHVAALHNEYLARQYEMSTFSLIKDVQKLNSKRRLKKAADTFYRFRTGPFANYGRFRYRNIFRYDTEGDVFEALDKRRGTVRRDEYLEGLVANMESQTRDLEARITKEDEGRVNLALGALGFFGLLQLVFSVADIFTPSGETPARFTVDGMPPFLHAAQSEHTLGDQLTYLGLYLSALATVGLIVFVCVILVFRILRR
ncbi:hypothetical protein [Hyphomonas chukchiensis]|uniref:Uncharacterized protein n=1 Tax=Hyphomonas chukchiensis TaxID=1280947 RepID=A0A062UIS5_9PROT|nr:hypothetical protein [Hyphomonas chukchiensis]KCZ58896.1 hypothetical protein HY30_03920 [Hyphomonas chukchiensis]